MNLIKKGCLLVVMVFSVLSLYGCQKESKKEDASKTISESTKENTKKTAPKRGTVAIETEAGQSIFSYLVKEDGVWIEGCENVPENLTIPSEIEGQAVVGLSTYAFSEKNMKKVILPETIKVIGDRAFMRCKMLEVVEFKAKNVKMELVAFIGCENIKKVIKPDDTNYILFMGNSLTSYAAVPKHMRDILGEMGKDEYTVFSNIKLGEGLDAHMRDEKQTGLTVGLELADIIIIQDAYIVPSRKGMINELYEKCGKDVDLYYWFTDWMEKPRRDKFTQMFEGHCGIRILNNGDLYDDIVSSGIYNERELWVVEDNHPNCLYGYFTAMYMYHEIFDEPISKLTDMEFLKTDVSNWLTTESKEKEMRKVKQVQKLIEEDENENSSNIR